jgi:hypothetical protein
MRVGKGMLQALHSVGIKSCLDLSTPFFVCVISGKDIRPAFRCAFVAHPLLCAIHERDQNRLREGQLLVCVLAQIQNHGPK